MLQNVFKNSRILIRVDHMLLDSDQQKLKKFERKCTKILRIWLAVFFSTPQQGRCTHFASLLSYVPPSPSFRLLVCYFNLWDSIRFRRGKKRGNERNSIGKERRSSCKIELQRVCNIRVVE